MSEFSSPDPIQACTKCGAELPAVGTNGLCPACLMAEVMIPSEPKSKATGPWEPPTAAELAALLPQYEITGLLGRGGMGAVYKGTQKALDRPVAIKILSTTLDESDQGFAERFKNEARAMAKLKHPGIVDVYDSGETSDGLLYIVMEFIEGTDVAKMIAKQGRLHTEHAMAITAHVCDALAYAHERGIIHRDIKPANIMVGYDGVVKVADFGLAKMTHSNASGLTQSGMAMGTLYYMAPEALMLGAGVDHRADIYAVGVMLYQMLTGKLPQGLFELPSLQVPGLDPRYDGIIGKALREDRDLRYPSVLDMRHDLDAILTQPVVKVEAAAEKAPAALETQARPQRPGGQPYRPPPPPMVMRSEKTGSPLLWVALIVMSGIAGWLFFKDSMKSGAAPSPEAPTATPTTATSPAVESIPPLSGEFTGVTKDKPFVNSLGMKFVPVPGTNILMCIHETRRKDYAAYASENPAATDSWRSVVSPGGYPVSRGDNDPVVRLNWDDAKGFCAWLSAKDAQDYRLPSDAEWSDAVGLDERESGKTPGELSLAAEVKLRFPWGDSWPPPNDFGNYADRSLAPLGPESGYLAGLTDGHGLTAPVMSYKPNALGIYDLSGNVWEWCEDLYTPGGNDRVLRGGCWYDGANHQKNLASNYRFRLPQSVRSGNIGRGFRVVVIAAKAAPKSSAPATPPGSTIKIDDAFLKANVLGTSWKTKYSNDSRHDILEFKSVGNEVIKHASMGGQQQAAWSIEDDGNTLKVLTDNGFYFSISFTSPTTARVDFVKKTIGTMVGTLTQEANAPVVAPSTPQPAVTSQALKAPAPIGDPPNTLKKVTQLIAAGVSERRPVGAAWKSVNGEWLSAVDDNSAGIQFPHKLTVQDYDYEVEFSFSEEKGGSFHQRVPVNGKALEWVMPFSKTAAGQRFEITGLSPTAVATAMPSLVAGKRYRSVVQVRQGSISAVVDGQTLVQFQGNPGDGKDVPNRLLDPKLLSLTVSKAAVTLHRVQLTEFISATTELTKSPTVDMTKPPTTGWKPMFPDLKKFKESPGVTEMIGGAFKLDKAALYPCNARDLAVRAKIKNGSSVQLVARALDDSAKPISKYWAGFFSKDNSMVLFRQWNDNGKGGGPRMANITLATSILTSPPKQDDDYVLTLLVYGDQLRVFMNDELIIEKKDSLLPGTFAGISGTGEVRDLEWVTLPQEAASASTMSATAPPAATSLPTGPTTWTDTQGRSITATFKAIASGNVLLDIAGRVTPVPFNTLSPESQKLARAYQDQSNPATTNDPAQATKDRPFLNTLGMKFVPVPGTKVLMCIHETRKKDYAVYASANPGVNSDWNKGGSAEDFPVVYLSWNDAHDFCNWLSLREGIKYRLSTDREWSVAIGLGNLEDAGASPESLSKLNLEIYPWGSSWPPPNDAGNFWDDAINTQLKSAGLPQTYKDGHGVLAPAMSFPANSLGLHDLCGNAFEYCDDWFNSTQKERVRRGGSGWTGRGKAEFRSSSRGHNPPDFRSRLGDLGFRCVIELPAP